MLAGGAVISPETWHHAAVTYDGATVRLYLDGALVNSAERSLLPNNNTLLVGVARDAASAHFNGLIDELSIFGRALRATEIYNMSRQDMIGVKSIHVWVEEFPFSDPRSRLDL